MRGHSIIPRYPGSISNKWYSFNRELTAVTYGLARTTTSASNATARHTGEFAISYHFVLTAIKWTFYGAVNHDVSIVADRDSSNPAVLFTIDAAFSATGGTTEDTIPLPYPILLLPGTHFIGVNPASAQRFNYNNDTTGGVSGGVGMYSCGSYTTGRSSNHTTLKIVGYPASILGLTDLMIPPV